MASARAGRMMEMFADEIMPHYLGQPARETGKLDPVILAMARDLGPDAFVRQSEALLLRSAYTDVVGAFEGPILALAGAEDKVCVPALHKEMAARAKHGRYVEIAACGHLSTLEQPTDVNAALEQFLNDVIGGE
jgi:pimeloyl-ACP methyl ester carboxylesterase